MEKGRLTEHFTWEEVFGSETAKELKINNKTTDKKILANATAMANTMEKVREILCCPIVVNSWFRCKELNRRLGGKTTSKHLEGLAVDFYIKGNLFVAAAKLMEHLKDYDQIIYYPEKHFIHLSISDTDQNRKQKLICIGGKYLSC